MAVQAPPSGEKRAILVRKLTRALAQGHPWIWREALTDCQARPGDRVLVADGSGRFVARGIADAGAIAVRVWTTDKREPVDGALMSRRAREAAALRRRVVPPETGAFRLVNGEGDRMPGVICDVYGSCAVLQLDGEGLLAWLGPIAQALRESLGGFGVEALLWRHGRGDSKRCEPLWGQAPSAPISVRERGLTLLVDPAAGQKTGLFLDHRESRARVRELSAGARVLNLFGYTGAFSAAAGAGGALSVDTVDSAAPALALAKQTWAANGLSSGAHRIHRADAFAFLAQAASRGESWDLIIADPPSFAPKQGAVPAALARYQKLHAACLALLAPGGLYLAASCSSHVRREAWWDTVVAAARPRWRLQLLDGWGAPMDHPRLVSFPEGDYLKCALVRPAPG